MDDGFFADKTYNGTRVLATETENDITQAGFTVNKPKSNLTPTQRGIHLGFIIDTTKMEFITGCWCTTKTKCDHLLVRCPDRLADGSGPV